MPEKRIVPIKGVNVDLSEMYLDELHATFIKNWTSEIGHNPRAGQDGHNFTIFTPLEKGAIYSDLKLPDGINYCVGYFHSWKTKEGYVFGWNSLGSHFIYRIRHTGLTEMVYMGSCLNFQLDPRCFIRDGRCEVKIMSVYDAALGYTVDKTFLLFVDNHSEHHMICVEDSIGTNFFNQSHYPNLTVADSRCKPCDFIALGLDTPRCVDFAPYAGEAKDAPLQNAMTFKAQQFRIRYTDVWGRRSEWGAISDQYISAIGGGCISESSGLPRCLVLSFSAGCAFIDRIDIAVRKDNGKTRGLSTTSDWYLYDTIYKYDNANRVPWWQRAVHPDQTYDPAKGLGWDTDTNRLYYKFCGNKECQPIDVNETNRLENPLPKTSSTLFGIGNGIGVGRNRRGYQPTDFNQLNKLDFSIEKPSQDTTCSISKTNKIKVWGVIYNHYDAVPVHLRIKDNAIVFGNSDCAKNNPFAYNQVLPTDQEGIIGYLAGTKSFSISKQYRYDTQTGDLVYVGTDFFKDLSGEPLIQMVRYLPLQLWEFDVLPGKYVFRLASHLATLNEDYQKTSTYLWGQTTLASPGPLFGEEAKELVIGACDGDVEIKDHPLLICDLTRSGKNCGDATKVNAGYLYEDEKEKKPIEKAYVSGSEGGLARIRYTDHNGFYFTVSKFKGLQTRFYGMKNGLANSFLIESDAAFDTAANWYKFQKLYVYKNDDLYKSPDRYVVKGRLTLCGNPAVGIAGASVIMTGTAATVTDNNGYFSIAAHDLGDTASPRNEKIIISQRGVCHLISCDTGCMPCFADTPVSAPVYSGADRFVTLADFTINIRGLNKKGPASGGRYGGAIIKHYKRSHMSFAQQLDKHYFDIPSLWEVGVFDFSKVKWTLDPTMRFEPECTGISFAITENLNWDDSIMWVMERIQLVDVTGGLNAAAPSKIRLYYQGLGEYNLQGNLSTTTAWEFITDSQGRQGDQVEFICNGDGAFFQRKIMGLITYDTAGKYIQVDYSDELKDLKDGCLVRIIRPKECVNKEFYYETCPIIDVVDGVPQQLSGYLNFYDSYLLSRQIPVPQLVDKKTKDATTGNEIVTQVSVDQLTSYPFLFEHHSPSDFWGDHAYPKGRVFIKNPNERETLGRMEIAISSAFVEGADFNGLSYFDEADIVNFEEADYGGLVMVFVEGNQVLCICEVNTFAVGYNDNRVRVGADGTVQVISLPNRMGNPQTGAGEKFGCDLSDINTISRYAGRVVWLDRNNAALVGHNFSSGHNLAGQDMGQFMSWLQPKIKFLVASNGNFYFHGVIDIKRNDYLLTMARYRADISDYVNTELEPVTGLPETIMVNLDSKTLRGWRSTTPEYWGALGAEDTDQQLFSFRFGQVWSHYGTGGYDSEYGEGVDRVMEVVCSNPQSPNLFLWMEVECRQHLFNVDRIITSSGQTSRIMKSWFERRNKVATASFKCALNTFIDPNLPTETRDNVLLDGDALYGQWIKARLVNERMGRGKYSELSSISIFFTPEASTSGG